MAENFSEASLVIPATYIRVRAEGLIGAGGVSTGNIGVVGTAAQGTGATHLVSDFAAALATFGPSDAYADGAGTLNLTRSLEVLYRNGAKTVYARGLAAGANQAAFAAAVDELIKDDINLVVAPELTTAQALAVLAPLVDSAEGNGKDLLAVVGSDAAIGATAATITGQAPTNDRIVFTAPGIQAFDPAANAGAGADVMLNGRFGAAAVAGLLSSLTPEASPTNKVIPGVVALARRFSYGETEALVRGRVLVLEVRGGVRVVRGLTSDDAAFTQVTTRRITDFAKAGIRKAANPFIGRLNNERVRKALRGAIDGFLTTMVVGEQLISYTLDVTATRQDEIGGRAVVTAVLQPTFSIDFIVVTLVLE